jgi:hypothetical protein
LGRVVDEADALGNVALETLNALGQKALLLLGDALQRVDGLLSTVGLCKVSQFNISRHSGFSTHAELNGNGEEVSAGLLGDSLTSGNTGKVDVAGLDEAGLALGGTEDLLGESVFGSAIDERDDNRSNIPETGVSHGQGGGTSTILGLDNLVTAKLDAVHEGIVLVVGDRDRRRGLAEERNNGLTRVTTNDGDGQALGVGLANDISDKGLCSDNVEGGDTEEALGVEDVLGLENLGRDGDCGVDGVGDDEDEGLGSDLGGDLDEALDNASIDVEEIVASHTRLACAGKVVSQELKLGEGPRGRTAGGGGRGGRPG